MITPSNPRVSVLVTVFNREHILGETIRSILESSFQDFEIVIVDDCSQDKSFQLAQSLAETDARIRVFRNEQNLGDYANRNRAAALANGRLLKYLDADDLMYRFSLATMVDAMDRFPLAGLALSWNVIDPDLAYPHLVKPVEFVERHFLGRSPIGVGPSAAIIRRECFDEVGGFSGKQFVGDTELWMKLGEKWPIVSLPPALVWWRRHEGQQMSLEIERPQVLNVRHRLELDYLNSTVHLSADSKRIAERQLKYRHGRRLLSLFLKRRNPRLLWQLLEESGLSVVDLFRSLR
jgi:glycosyltransferase involved in cell wall biosynthesis